MRCDENNKNVCSKIQCNTNRKSELWYPNAAINKNTSGTLIKFGRYIRIDSEIKNIIHIHLRLLGRSINHFLISMIAGEVIGGF